MKKVKVKYIHTNDIDEGILFESLDDIKYLRPALKKAEAGVLTKFVKSGESPDRLNHIVWGFKPLEKCIANLSILHGSCYDVNTIYTLGNSSEVYIRTLSSQLEKGTQVFQNSNGGLCPVKGSLEIVEILENELTELEEEASYKIGENSKVINLENDWCLEDNAINFMEKRFGAYKTFSYIKDLKATRKHQYQNIFKQFKQQGGEYVYVYTTGIDVEQMYEYSMYALDAGLNNFIFDFNKGLDKEINKFIDWLSQRANVEILNK